jgi:hypothetical protein
MTMATSPRDSRETTTAPHASAPSPQDRTSCTDDATSPGNVDQTIAASLNPSVLDMAAGSTAVPSEVRRKRKAAPAAAPLSINQKPVLTVSETALLGAHSPGALRHLIFNSEAWIRYPDGKYRRSMGFDRCIIRPPGQRRIFIDRVKYLQWLNSNTEVTP